MVRSPRYLVNALVCVAVLVHGAYWLATGGIEAGPNLRIALAIAEVVVGIVGAVWFWGRSRGLSL